MVARCCFILAVLILFDIIFETDGKTKKVCKSKPCKHKGHCVDLTQKKLKKLQAAGAITININSTYLCECKPAKDKSYKAYYGQNCTLQITSQQDIYKGTCDQFCPTKTGECVRPDAAESQLVTDGSESGSLPEDESESGSLPTAGSESGSLPEDESESGSLPTAGSESGTLLTGSRQVFADGMYCRCKAGKSGPRCADDCESGWFGEGCSSRCHPEGCKSSDCKAVSGCSKCQPGYTNRPYCDEKGKTPCTKKKCKHGECAFPGDRLGAELVCDCSAGWTGEFCTVSCKETRRYGRNCKSRCGNCDKNKPCDPKTGRCKKCAKKAGDSGERYDMPFCLTGTYMRFDEPVPPELEVGGSLDLTLPPKRVRFNDEVDVREFFSTDAPSATGAQVKEGLKYEIVDQATLPLIVVTPSEEDQPQSDGPSPEEEDESIAEDYKRQFRKQSIVYLQYVQAQKEAPSKSIVVRKLLQDEGDRIRADFTLRIPGELGEGRDLQQEVTGNLKKGTFQSKVIPGMTIDQESVKVKKPRLVNAAEESSMSDRTTAAVVSCALFGCLAGIVGIAVARRNSAAKNRNKRNWGTKAKKSTAYRKSTTKNRRSRTTGTKKSTIIKSSK